MSPYKEKNKYFIVIWIFWSKNLSYIDFAKYCIVLVGTNKSYLVKTLGQLELSFQSYDKILAFYCIFLYIVKIRKCLYLLL